MVDVIMGFQNGTLPLISRPFVFSDANQVDQLVWNSFCGVNLATYLSNNKHKIGIVAKGCDSRNIINHIIENQIKREQLFIIGMPCSGMIDRNKVQKLADGMEIINAIDYNDTIKISGDKVETSIEKSNILQDNCKTKTCVHKNPVIYDELVGTLLPEVKDPKLQNIEPFEDVNAIKTMSSDERWQYFDTFMKNASDAMPAAMPVLSNLTIRIISPHKYCWREYAFCKNRYDPMIKRNFKPKY
mmetsp:Transcript_264/g.133  ORF Transcript_264/g.133 Transcript_264/m.133 type:complete len:243 (-) Transcript_264:3813-4541(-)